MKPVKWRAASVAWVLTASGASFAESRIDPVTSFAAINDGTVSRCLVRVDLPGDLGPVAIARAELIFDLSGSSREGVIRLALHPVTTPWTAESADWTSGWRVPGGDIDPELISRTEVDLSQAVGEVRFDVTSILKEQAEAGGEYFGFLVTTQPEFGEGVRLADADRLAGLSSARLEVRYRKVTARPSGRAD